jgi:hypothetical protein
MKLKSKKILAREILVFAIIFATPTIKNLTDLLRKLLN